MRKRRCQRLQKVQHWDIITNGTAWRACVAHWWSILQSFFGPKRVCATDLIVLTSDGSGRPALLQESVGFWEYCGLWCHISHYTTNSQYYRHWIHGDEGLFFQLEIRLCLGLDWCICWYVRPTPAGHPALIWWIWCSWIDLSILHWLSMRSLFPELIKLHASVHGYRHYLIPYLGGLGHILAAGTLLTLCPPYTAYL